MIGFGHFSYSGCKIKPAHIRNLKERKKHKRRVYIEEVILYYILIYD